MDKLKMQTTNLADDNFAALAALFPKAITETIVGYEPVLDKDGNQVVGLDGIPKERAIVERSIDADVLAQEINSHVVSGKEERYQFTWPDKRKSILLANSPIAAALRPRRDESVDFGTTENLYIEGDNLDVLKLLRETYLNRVKMIYIDPPYNTGKDFVYEDDFSEDTGEFLRRDGQYDEQGNRLTPNLDSNGRFHTDWLNMIYPRLRVARDLLTNDGVIFISIDNNEVKNLMKVCDEIFGAVNFVAQISVINNPRGRQSDTFVATTNEFLICYAKNLNECHINGQPLTEEQKAEYNYFDNERGAYRLLGLRQRGSASLRTDRPDMYFPVYVNPRTEEVSLEEHEDWECVLPKKSDGRDGRWMWGKEKCFNEHYRLVARKIERRGEYDIFVKDFLIRNDGERSRKFNTVWDDKEYNNQAGTQEVKALLGGDYMSFPKSRKYIQSICTMGSDSNSIVLDFFSGSATTAHAVMQLNAGDGGHRKFIMVQLPEVCPPDGEAAKAGYETICDIGEERIRRAGVKIKEEAGMTAQGLDTGFRILKLDSSNMKDVYYTPEEYANMNFALDGFVDNIKEDRTDEDLLFQVMLDLGIPLSAKIKQDGKIFYVNDNYLIACFGKVDTALITEIAKKQPYYAVFRDSSFINDSAMVNFEQVFATYSPSTIRRVL